MVREDELLVKNVLEYFVYGRHSLEVGDNYALLLPDIYTKNHDVGIEVVNAELYVDQRKKSFLEYYLENNYTEKQKQILRMLANAQAFDIPAKLWLKTLIGEEKYKQYQDYVAFAKKKGDLHKDVLQGKKITELETSIFKKRVQKKIEKLLQGNYNGCQHVNLCVTAWKRPRGQAYVEQNIKMLEELQQQYGKTFERIFLIELDGIYVYKNAKIELKEDILKTDWQQILQCTFVDWDAHKAKVDAEREKRILAIKQSQEKNVPENKRNK